MKEIKDELLTMSLDEMLDILLKQAEEILDESKKIAEKSQRLCDSIESIDEIIKTRYLANTIRQAYGRSEIEKPRVNIDRYEDRMISIAENIDKLSAKLNKLMLSVYLKEVNNKDNAEALNKLSDIDNILLSAETYQSESRKKVRECIFKLKEFQKEKSVIFYSPKEEAADIFPNP